MKTELLSASDELMTAVFNGAYQGAILTLLVYLVLRLIGPTNAATRYSVWGATLALVIGVIPAHYFRNRFFPDLPALAIAAPKTTPFLNTSPARLPDALTPEFLNIEQAPFVEWELVPNQEIGPLSEFDTDAGTSLDLPSAAIAETAARSGLARNEPNETLGAGARPNASVETGPGNLSARQETPSSAGWNLERMLNPISWNITSLAGFPKIGSVVLLLTWLSIAVFKAGLLSGRLYQIRKIKKTALPAGPELTGLFARLRADLAVRRKVDIKLCPVQASPVALGFFHPIILLPEEYANSPEAPETEHILRHELAHVRRRDDWANLAQNFIQAGLFFHPAVWWICKRLSLEREIACDDQVLQRGAGPRAYALLLAELAGRLKRHDLVLAQGVSSSKSQLQQRINMILNTRRNTSPVLAKARLGFVTASAALIALLAIYSAPRVVLAQAPAAVPAIAATPATPATAATSAAPAGPAIALVASADEPDTASVAVAAPDVDPGPKFKPGDALPKPVAPAAVNITPLPAPGPGIVIAGDIRPRGVPVPPGVPGSPSSDGSLEERIERLEQMVHSLMDQQKHHGPFVLRGRGGGDVFADQKEIEKFNAKINEMAKKQAEMADQQAKHAAEMAERANKDFNFKWKAEAEQWQKGRGKEGFEKQLEALRKAREGLERQMQNLDRQIERVERDQERMQEEKERRSELKEEEPKEEEAASVAENEEN